MRLKHKKAYISGIAVTLAGVLGIGALLQSGISVQASPAMMPGIEQIIKEKGNKEPFRILELVDDKKDAEIGWYVSGQEPYLKLYEYTTKDNQTIHFSTLEEGLKKLPSDELRKEFANNGNLKEDGTYDRDGGTVKDVTSLCFQDGMNATNPQEEYPLSYKEYREKYFLSPEDKEEDWKRVDFLTLDESPRIDKVPLQGQYVPNPSGTGDYTKQPQKYYPIRQNTEDKNKPEKYRENIKDFFYLEGTGATAPYQLEFAEVKNETVNEVFSQNPVAPNNVIYREYDHTAGRYGYYERVYADLTKELSENTTKYPGEKATIEKEGTFIRENQPLPVAELFSAGDDTPFSSNEVQTAKEEPIIEEEPFAENAFSDGNSPGAFSSEDVAEELPQSEEMSIPESDSVMAAPPVETANPESECKYPPLGKEHAGTQRDPWVYLGELIEQFPNYKYTLVSDLDQVKAMAAQKAEEDKKNLDEGKPIVRNDGDISLENDQYFYWKPNAEGEIEKHSLSIVTGYQPVAYKDIRPIAENLGYNYYFRVEKVYFCCELSTGEDEKNPEAYQYFGWYYPSFPPSEEQYLPIKDQEEPTHYISEAEYKLTEGVGDYDFVPGDGEGTKEHLVEVNHMFYQGGYTNHDWLKKYVFHLEKNPDNSSKEGAEEEKPTEWEQFAIEVTTMLPKELDQTYGTQTVQQDSIEEEPSAAEAFTDQEAFIDAEENTSETVPVEPMISESQETLEAAELFTDNSQTEEPAFTSEEAPQPEEHAEEMPQPEEHAEKTLQLESQNPAQAFTSGVEATAQTAWEAFDLIYVNGNLSSSLAETLAKSGVPCIINERILQPTEGTESAVKTAFAGFIKENDTDSHYVTEYVYVFKNTWDPSNPEDKSRLLNLQFHRNFNPDAQEGNAGSSDAIKGFEEILEYIEKENQYRQIGKTDTSQAATAEFTDGSQTSGQNPSLTDGTTKEKIPLLDKKLSHARAIEYIINYKHKRTITPKKEINVLEIQAGNKGTQLNNAKVLGWLGDSSNYDSVSVKAPDDIKVCCAHKNHPGNYMVDDKDNTIWHNDWSSNAHNGTNHVITMTYNNPATFYGIRYLKRPDGNNGRIDAFKIRYFHSKDEIVPFQEEETGWTANSGKYHLYIPYQPVKNVGKIELEVTKAVTDNSGKKLASCADLRLISKELPYVPKINIKTMTSSEFVGHIEDINTKYDMIYIGSNGDRDLNSKRKMLIHGEGKRLYTHVGGAIIGQKKFQGLMNQDYQGGKPPTSANPKGHLIEEGFELGKLGSYRGSGNDITQQQVNAIKDFAVSGYPVIISKDLFKNGEIDTEKVDNSSYVYQLLRELTKDQAYKNVYNESKIDKKGIDFFARLPKPVIDFSKGFQPESAIGDKYGPSAEYLKTNVLEYKFEIRDEAHASPANARYHCQLFVDLNSDGNFSDKEELKDLQIQDSGGNYLHKSKEGVFELSLGETYTVSRQLPKKYYKLITWKLKVSNNTKPELFATAQGYSKQKVDSSDLPEIKILQIYPDTGGNWILNQDKTFMNYLNQGTSGEFRATIVEKKISEFVEEYKEGYTRPNNPGNILDVDGYDMLIIGFDDVYQNIPNEKPDGQPMGAVDAILKFVKDGKSILFAHDTTSFVNVDMDKIDNNLKNLFGNDSVIKRRWGYSLNTLLRPLVGMDRYGITDISKKDDSSKSISEILKEAKALSYDESSASDWNTVSKNGEMAYKAGRERKETYWETHGYTNALLYAPGAITSQVKQVNKGAITEYPYKIPDTINVAQTHAQYYQLAMEEDENQDGLNDIIVWYCLDGGYNDSPKDVRNNYYLYSKGNVMYTGVGHSNVQNANNEFEKKLFVNTIVAAYRAGAVSPNIHFVEDFNIDAPKKQVEYYATDQLTSLPAEGNVLDNKKDFFLTVSDDNLIAADSITDDIGKLELELFIDSSNPSARPGQEYGLDGISTTVEPVNTHIYENNWNHIVPSKQDYPNKKLVSSGSVCAFTIDNLEKYLKDDNGNYKNNVHIYAKVSKKMNYYGKEIEGKAFTSIALNQRQLFDLD